MTSSLSDAPVGVAPTATRDEPRAYAAPVGGDPAFVPDSVIVPEDALTLSGGAGAGTGSPPPPVSPARANAVLVALAVAAFLVVSNEISPMGLLDSMSKDLGRSEAEIGLAATVFAIAVMIATLPLALLTTRFVRRWVIVGALGLLTVGTFLAASADTYSALLMSRVVTGSAHALFWAVVTPAAAGMFPLADRGKSVARLMLGASAAGVIGLPGETYLAQHVGWHTPYWIITAGAALLAIVIAILMPSFRTQQATIVRGEIPSLGRFGRVMAVTALSTAAMSLTWTYFTPFVTEVAGFADDTVPLLLLYGGGVGVITTWMVARYLDRWPVKSVVLGEGLLVVMFGSMAVLGSFKVAAIGIIGLQGIGWSILVSAMINWALRHSPWTSDIGNGTYAVLFNTGNAVGSRAGAVILAAWGAQWLPAASVLLVGGALAIAATTPRLRRLRR